MAHRVYKRHIVQGAGTPIATPGHLDVSFPQGEVKRITIQIPTGWCGLAGIRLLQAQNQVLPLDAGTFLSGDGVVFDTEFADDLRNGNWQVEMYNLDIYDHGAYLTFYVDEIAPDIPSAAPGQPLILPQMVAP